MSEQEHLIQSIIGVVFVFSRTDCSYGKLGSSKRKNIVHCMNVKGENSLSVDQCVRLVSGRCYRYVLARIKQQTTTILKNMNQETQAESLSFTATRAC